MRYFIIILAYLLSCSNILGQRKVFIIPTYKDGDTSLWYKWNSADQKKIGLVDLKSISDSTYIRIWSETQAIDIWTNDFINFQGQLSNYTEQVNEPKSEKFYSETISIDTSLARIIYTKLLEYSILEIPQQDSIKGWEDGLDGNEFIIEYSNPTKYSFKEYWTPSHFKEIKEAVAIQNMITYIFTTLKFESKWNDFVKKLPKGCYKAGGIMMTCPNMTKKEIKKKYYN